MHEPEGYECPFCHIAGGDLPDRVVHRNDDVMVLVNHRWWPNNAGGLLVVPIEHHENVYELPPWLGTPLQLAVRDAARALKSAFSCEGVSTRQHNEPAGNQDVWHYHTHVFPRWAGDDLYRTRGELVSTDEVNRVAAMLREHWPPWESWVGQPAKPGAAGVLLWDDAGRLLIVEPAYRTDGYWSVPGGGIERGESPRDAATRETREEIGIDVDLGRLVCVDHRSTRPDSLHFIFDGGVMSPEQIAAIRLREDELRSYRFATLDDATTVLHPPLAKRISAGVTASGVYLEDGELSPVARLRSS